MLLSKADCSRIFVLDGVRTLPWTGEIDLPPGELVYSFLTDAERQKPGYDMKLAARSFNRRESIRFAAILFCHWTKKKPTVGTSQSYRRGRLPPNGRMGFDSPRSNS